MKKKITVSLLACMIVLALSVSAMASSLDSLKTTISLGPFQIKQLGLILYSTETEAETTGGQYGLLSLEDMGMTSQITEESDMDELNAGIVTNFVNQLKENGTEAEEYLNKNGLHGLYYIQEIEQAKLLTIMFVYGKDCLLAVLSQSPGIYLTSSYVQSIMDDYSLILPEE